MADSIAFEQRRWPHAGAFLVLKEQLDREPDTDEWIEFVDDEPVGGLWATEEAFEWAVEFIADADDKELETAREMFETNRIE